MTQHLLLQAPIALIPVLALFGTLLYFDSFDLVSVREVAMTITAGIALCLASLGVNALLIEWSNLDFAHYSQFVAPFVEETLKAIALIYLFSRNRIGFVIDAAIMGFAVGTGFALVENIYLLYAFPQANLGVWIIRGFGTAIMHGGATALFGMIAQILIERNLRPIAVAYLPALLAAALLHAAFNILGSSPLIATAFLLVACPLSLVLMFTRSEHAVHDWLLSDYENHQHLLETIKSGEFQHEEGGRLFLALAGKFSQDRLSDMFAYMRIHTELVLRSERISLGRESGEEIAVTAQDVERFRELHRLERRIGKTALMTIRRHLHFSRRELWELNELEGELWRA
ncbi:MAG TPA: PrsW family glutamic-type intramembrane protease [Rhizomicrobium sp.]|nr:PrsW family glutamic-type intramembrane protease [Rhizomicrobium sp.]